MPTLRASALVMTAVMRNNVRPDPQLPSRILRKVWPLALIVAVLMIAASTSIYLVSSFRGVLIGESLWSKAQKDAVYYLNSYVDSANPADLEKFRAALKIPAGDRAVLQALEKKFHRIWMAHRLPLCKAASTPMMSKAWSGCCTSFATPA